MLEVIVYSSPEEKYLFLSTQCSVDIDLESCRKRCFMYDDPNGSSLFIHSLEVIIYAFFVIVCVFFSKLGFFLGF
jgi:hypothetical protein